MCRADKSTEYVFVLIGGHCDMLWKSNIMKVLIDFVNVKINKSSKTKDWLIISFISDNKFASYTTVLIQQVYDLVYNLYFANTVCTSVICALHNFVIVLIWDSNVRWT